MESPPWRWASLSLRGCGDALPSHFTPRRVDGHVHTLPAVSGGPVTIRDCAVCGGLRQVLQVWCRSTKILLASIGSIHVSHHARGWRRVDVCCLRGSTPHAPRRADHWAAVRLPRTSRNMVVCLPAFIHTHSTAMARLNLNGRWRSSTSAVGRPISRC